jgi:hypothetical protein
MSVRHLVVLSCVLLFSACNKVSEANYAKLTSGMTRDEVQSLLGAPTECAGALGVSSCNWGDEKSSISVQFAADKVLLFSGQGLK